MYLDASVLVPMFIEEDSSSTVTRWIAQLDDRAVVSMFAAGEFASAVSRLVRNQDISAAYGQNRLAEFDAWCVGCASTITTDMIDVARAATLVRRFELKLRMPDAVHAAACERLGLMLATFDTRLAKGANALGLMVSIPT